MCGSLGMNIGECTDSGLLLRNSSQATIIRMPGHFLHIPLMVV